MDFWTFIPVSKHRSLRNWHGWHNLSYTNNNRRYARFRLTKQNSAMICTHVCQWTESGRGTPMRCSISDRYETRAPARGRSCRAREVCLWTLRTEGLTTECIRSLRPGPDEGKASRSHRAHSWKEDTTIITDIPRLEQLLWTRGTCTTAGQMMPH
jgi:hypothetical protein